MVVGNLIRYLWVRNIDVPMNILIDGPAAPAYGRLKYGVVEGERRRRS